MANTARSKTAQNTAAVYKSSRRWESNRMRKLARTLKEQPTNEQVKAAMKSMVYRRKTPNTQEWSASWIRVAKLFKLFTGKFDRAIMNANPDIVKTALSTSRRERPAVKFTEPEKRFFSLEARANINSKQ